MKTQIIPLEPYDNLVSVYDKLAWARTPRILLVWPPRGRVDLRPLDLKLLQRRAGELGAQLGLVTRSEEILQSARQIGLPVFASAAEAQRMAWPPPAPRTTAKRRARRPDLRSVREQIRPREPAWLSNPIVRVGLFALGVLAALAVMVFFIPRAQVFVPMPVQIQSVDLPISAGDSVPAVSLTGALPVQELEVTLDGTETIPVSGTVSLPQGKARGVVTFRNLTTQTVTVPAGTVVRTPDTPPLRFQTTRSGEVAAEIGAELDLPVEALQPGKAGNVPAGAIQALEGTLGPLLAVSNANALQGGTDLSLRGPSAADRQRVRDVLLASLERQALATLERQSAGGLLLPNTLQVEILEEAYTPPAGQPADRLTLSLRVRCTAEHIRRADLEFLANAVLDAGLEAGEAAVPDSLNWEQLSPPVTAEDGLSRFRLRLSRQVWQVANAGQVIQLTQGLTPASARQRLQANLHLAGEPRFLLWPEWWPWLPLAPTRIEVAFEFP